MTLTKSKIAVIACGALASHVHEIAERNHWDLHVEPVNPLLHNRPEGIAPEVEKLVAKNLAIANKIAELLQHKGLKAADLARLLNKKPSEISKWLTGTHTFTT
jgi:hypothetical protein